MGSDIALKKELVKVKIAKSDQKRPKMMKVTENYQK